MHANPQRLQIEEPGELPSLRPVPPGPTLGAVILRFLRLLRLAFWRAFQHDAFSIAKASAYSSILTFFPLLLVIGSVLASFSRGQAYMLEVTTALGSILPVGSATATAFLKSSAQHSTSLVITTSLLTLWTGSGVMISWMEGFRRSYELPKIWGLVKERMISFSLVIMAGIPLMFATILVASGSNIERTVLFHMNHEFGFYILLMWSAIRWLIATLTSIAVIALIYHHAVPRTQPWHSVLPGAALATAMWFGVTMIFGWYLQHYANYSIMYGSLGAAIALLVWMYLISLVVLVGAEFNAMLFPRAMLGRELNAVNGPRAAD
jgi:membrane protein